MKIKLYKNCIVNSNYTEVFRNKNLLEQYLTGLSSLSEINIDLSYGTLSGTLCFEPPSGVNVIDWHEYNYIKITNNDNSIIYAFINGIDIINDMCIVAYACDDWHTFDGKWTLRKSLVSRSRKPLTGHLNELPLDYIGFGTPTIYSLENSDYYLEKVCFLIEFQLYDLASGDNLAERENYFGLYNGHVINNVMTQSNYWEGNEITREIDYILKYMPGKSFLDYSGASVERRYCDIVNIYLLPRDTNIESVFSGSLAYFPFGYPRAQGDTTHLPRNGIMVYGIKDNELPNPIFGEELELPPTKEIKSIGIFTNQINVPYTSKSITAQFITAISNFHFSLYLAIQSNIIDVTEQFKLSIPFTTVTGDVLAQREIARKTQTIKGITGIVNNLSNIGKGAYNVSQGTSALGAVKSGGVLKGMTKAETRAYGTESVMEGGSRVVGGITGIVNNYVDIKNANAEKYLSSYSNNNYDNAIDNATNGIVAFAHNEDNIANAEEVNDAINESGYATDKIVDSIDLDLSTTGWDYNVVKFGFVRVNGLTKEINEVIESILTNGVKIWYQSNIEGTTIETNV